MKSFRVPSFRSIRNLFHRHTEPRHLPWARENLDDIAAARMTTVLAVINNKGGVGKTTLAVNLAAALALRSRVLLIDLDPQGSATRAIGRTPADDMLSTLTHFFHGDVTLDYAVRTTRIGGLDYVAGGLSLVEMETHLAPIRDRDWLLHRGLASLKATYGYVIIDCPPHFGTLARNALVAADGFIAPVQPHFLGLEGLKNLMHLTETYRSRELPLAPLLGVTLSMVDTSQPSVRTISQQIRDSYGDQVFATEIPYRHQLAEAPMSGKPIFSYEGSSRASHSFWNLSKEVIDRCRRLQQTPLPSAPEALPTPNES